MFVDSTSKIATYPTNNLLLLVAAKCSLVDDVNELKAKVGFVRDHNGNGFLCYYAQLSLWTLWCCRSSMTLGKADDVV